MRRRDILAGAGSLAAGATLSFPAPAIAQGIRQLKMVTDWRPEDTPGLHSSAVGLAQTIGAATGGRIKIEVFPAGAFVRPFETFDAVGAGVADMYHSSDYYFEKKSPAFNFFSAVPFGFTADELFAWVQYGGGQELWDALSGQFNIKSLLCANTGCQMGGWFTREITSPEGFKGLRYRMPGLGAEVLRRLGAIVVTLPVSEIMPALKSGAIDASELDSSTTILDDSEQYLRAREAEAMCDHVWIFEARTLSTQPVRRRVAETRTHAADETLRTAALVRGLVGGVALLEILELLEQLHAGTPNFLSILRQTL